MDKVLSRIGRWLVQSVLDHLFWWAVGLTGITMASVWGMIQSWPQGIIVVLILFLIAMAVIIVMARKQKGRIVSPIVDRLANAKNPPTAKHKRESLAEFISVGQKLHSRSNEVPLPIRECNDWIKHIELYLSATLDNSYVVLLNDFSGYTFFGDSSDRSKYRQAIEGRLRRLREFISGLQDHSTTGSGFTFGTGSIRLSMTPIASGDCTFWEMIDRIQAETAYGAITHWSHLCSDLIWAVRESRVRVWARPRRPDIEYHADSFPADKIVSFDTQEYGCPVRIRTTDNETFWYEPKFVWLEVLKEFSNRHLEWTEAIEYLLDKTAIGNSSRQVSYAEGKLTRAAVSADQDMRISIWGIRGEDGPPVPIPQESWNSLEFRSDGFKATLGPYVNLEIPGSDLMRVWPMQGTKPPTSQTSDSPQ